MDPAVALVRAYLHVNGYFTVTEYPVLEAVEAGGWRTVTDLDLLAFRFPGAGRRVGRDGPNGLDAFEPDPALDAPPDRADMLVAEVKESAAQLNRAATDPVVLEVALARFGCCPASEVEGAVGALRRDGRATLPNGHVVRLVAFGLPPEEPPGAVHVVTLGHVSRFLREYLTDYWDALRHTDTKDPAIGILMAMEKGLRGEDG